MTVLLAYSNFACVIGSDFLDAFFSEEHYAYFVDGKYSKGDNHFYGFHDNNGRFYTEEDYARLKANMRNKSWLNLGVSNIGGGLGGGATLGIDSWAFYNCGNHFVTHEFGHCMGFGHSSSFCYGEFEQELCSIWNVLIYLRKVPYVDENWVRGNEIINNDVRRYIVKHREYFVNKGIFTNSEIDILAQWA